MNSVNDPLGNVLNLFDDLQDSLETIDVTDNIVNPNITMGKETNVRLATSKMGLGVLLEDDLGDIIDHVYNTEEITTTATEMTTVETTTAEPLDNVIGIICQLWDSFLDLTQIGTSAKSTGDPMSPEAEKFRAMAILIIFVIGLFIFALLLISCICCQCNKKKKRRKVDKEYFSVSTDTDTTSDEWNTSEDTTPVAINIKDQQEKCYHTILQSPTSPGGSVISCSSTLLRSPEQTVNSMDQIVPSPGSWTYASLPPSPSPYITTSLPLPPPPPRSYSLHQPFQQSYGVTKIPPVFKSVDQSLLLPYYLLNQQVPVQEDAENRTTSAPITSSRRQSFDSDLQRRQSPTDWDSDLQIVSPISNTDQQRSSPISWTQDVVKKASLLV